MSCSSNGDELYHMLRRGEGFESVCSKLPVDRITKEFENDLSDEDRKLWDIVFQGVQPSQTSEGNDVWKKLADKIIALLAEEREHFLSLAGFSVDCHRRNEMEDILYLKPAFICKTSLKKSEDILDVLLADQDVIFTSDDESYLINTINSENNRLWKQFANNPKSRKELYDGLHVWSRVWRANKETCIAILGSIFVSAAANHQSIRGWCKTQRLTELPADEQITFLQQMVPQYKVSPEICRILVDDALPKYIDKIELYSQKEYRPTFISEDKYQIPAKLFISYKARLRRLKRLKDGYKREIDSLLSLSQCRAFSFHSPNPEIYHEIENHILEFFAQIGISLKACTRKEGEGKGNRNVTQRIAWAMEEKSVSDVLKPVFLMCMAVCCGQGITSGREYPIPTKFPVYDDKMGKPRQRYEQLILLDRLCDTLSIEPEDRLKNWTQYLHWQGKTILSSDEARLWRDHLGENYESLPAIGFQLCCADYMENCVPFHPENLLYCSTNLRCNGYSEFYAANQRTIEEQSKQLAQTQGEIVTKYRQQWRHAKEYFSTGEKWLNSHLEEIDLDKFSAIPACDRDELKRLILETELQLAVCDEARTILVKLCKQVYQLSPSLFQ